MMAVVFPRRRPHSRAFRSLPRRWLKTTTAMFVAGWLVVTVVRPAVADEDDWQVGARVGLANVVVDGRNPFGARLALDGQYGLNDAWAVRVTAAGSRHTVSEDAMRGLPGGTIYSYSGFAGLSYTMDILRLLPSFDVGVGFLGIGGGGAKPRKTVGMQAAVAADYMLTPRWSLGAVAEYVYAPFDLISNALKGTAAPQAFALSARVSWIIQ